MQDNDKTYEKIPQFGLCLDKIQLYKTYAYVWILIFLL